MSVISNILNLIGNTPILDLKESLGYNIFAKCEFLNPGGSIKDRIAKNMIESAEKNNILKKGMTIIEPTSGNTGIGLALVSVRKGYKVIIVMPENMSEERKKIIRALDAELILTKSELGVKGAVDMAESICNSDKEKYFMPQQFKNEDNWLTHYKYTAAEIVKQIGKKIDIFVSGVGSGGTMQGIAKYLLEVNKNTKIIAIEPKGSSSLLHQRPKDHQIQGIGDGFIPDILDESIINDIIEVSDDEAIKTTKNLIQKQGLLVGISSGANIYGSIQAIKKYGKDKTVATLLPDRAERYFSTQLFSF